MSNRNRRPQVELLEDRITPADMYSIKENLVYPWLRELEGYTTEYIARTLVFDTPSVSGLAVGYGPDVGSWKVRLYEDIKQYQEFTAYASPNGEPHAIHVATGDVTGDGVEDVITALDTQSYTITDFATPFFVPVPAVPVRVFDGTTLNVPNPAPIAEFHPYGNLFYNGIHVASADLDGDGHAEVVVSNDGGGLAQVKVFDGSDLAVGTATEVADFVGIDGDPNATRGAHIATGDVNGDGTPDVVVGAAGGPRVAVFDGSTLRTGSKPQKVFGDFFSFNPGTFGGGIHVAVTDLDADGYGEIISGALRGAPLMSCIDGEDLTTSNGAIQFKWWEMTFGDPNSNGGLRLIGKDLDGITRGDLAVSHGDGSQVTIIRGSLVAPRGSSILFASDFDVPDPTWNRGVWVG